MRMTIEEVSEINSRIKTDNFDYIKSSCKKLLEKGVVYTYDNTFRRYNPYTSNFDKISENEVLEMFNNVFYNNWGNYNNLMLVKKHILKVNVKILDNYSNYLHGKDKTNKAKSDFKKVLDIIKQFK